MKLNLQDITFIIVSFRAEKVIHSCIDSLPENSKIIIIENSNNINLKKDLETKYDNIEVIINENQGMGASNNIGIKKAQTKYVYILNPDVTFRENTFTNLVNSLNLIDDFSIISPINEDKNLPNYEVKNKYFNNTSEILEVDTIDGFSMLLNKSKFKDDQYFDENFFLYLENTDLCLRQKIKNEKIFIIKNSSIKHLGAYTSKHDQSNNIEYIRNWHWMWSKFYYNKKHHGYLVAFLKTFNNLFSAFAKYLFYSIILNAHKKNIYKMRLSGLISSMIGKNSYLRPLN